MRCRCNHRRWSRRPRRLLEGEASSGPSVLASSPEGEAASSGSGDAPLLPLPLLAEEPPLEAELGGVASSPALADGAGEREKVAALPPQRDVARARPAATK